MKETSSQTFEETQKNTDVYKSKSFLGFYNPKSYKHVIQLSKYPL